jgi:RHS repeat-associated protein
MLFPKSEYLSDEAPLYLEESYITSYSATATFSPFGELIRSTGAMANVNPFRFSTKWQDNESGFLYYGYRYYNPSTGRWLNRDPIGEDGGVNLYGFVGNDGVDSIDMLGLDEVLHATQPSYVSSIVETTLKAGKDGTIWLSSPSIGGSGASAEATAHLIYDVNMAGVKDVPECVIKEAQKAANQALKGKGLSGAVRNASFGRFSGDYIANWVKNQPESVFRMKGPGKHAAGEWFIVKPEAWNSLKPKLMRLVGPGANEAFKQLSFKGRARTLGPKAGAALHVGGRILLVAGMVTSGYEIYTAQNKTREITKQVGGWTGAIALGAGGAEVGAFAGPYGSLGGGLLGALGGWFLGTSVTETAYDWLFEPGFQY